MTLSLLFSFYSNLMLAYYAPDKSEQGIANMLGLRTPWQARIIWQQCENIAE